jgi:hypothetical protein
MLPAMVPLALAIWCLLGLALLCCLPFTVPYALLQRWAEHSRLKRWQQALARQNRLLQWDQIEPSLSAGEGCLIIRYGALGYKPGEVIIRSGSPRVEDECELWWTEENLASLEPGPELAAEGGWYFLRGSTAREFARRYLNPKDGTAALVRTAEKLPKDGFLWQHYRRHYPATALVLLD